MKPAFGRLIGRVLGHSKMIPILTVRSVVILSLSTSCRSAISNGTQACYTVV